MLWRKWARDIAKVGVEGSNPFARSKFLFKIKVLPMGDPEERFVHWRATGAKRVEQTIDGTNGVGQIRGIERGIKFGRAVVPRLVAKLRRHLPGRNAVLAHPAGDGVADRIGIDVSLQPAPPRACPATPC